jgi:prophage regulatory protein
VPRSLLRLPEVLKRTAESRSGAYRKMKEGTFPLPIPIGKRANAWIDSEIDNYVEAQIRAARQPATPRRPPVARRKEPERNTPPARAPATE